MSKDKPIEQPAPQPKKEERRVPTNRDPISGDYIGDQGGYHD